MWGLQQPYVLFNQLFEERLILLEVGVMLSRTCEKCTHFRLELSIVGPTR